MTKGFDIPPDAVRVWRGYRAATLQLTDFFNKLGTVFVPATVEMQIAAGLDGYIPSVPAGLPGKPNSTPDETAILFWDSQQTYTDGFKTLAVRTYTLTHGAVYRPPSGAAVPIAYAGALAAEQPYYLIDRPADWMHGEVSHLIGSRPAAVAPDAFRDGLAPIIRRHSAAGRGSRGHSLRRRRLPGLLGARRRETVERDRRAVGASRMA